MGYQNFFATKLYTDIGASDTTITLDQAPTETSGRLVLEARNPTQREIIKYTGVSGNQITGVSRGQGGTTAKTHVKGSLVEMNATAEDFSEALGVPNDIITRFSEVISDHVASGCVWTDDTLLTADMSSGVIYLNGTRFPVSAISNRAFTASKDTYIDFGNDGVVDYNEVANGATAPALAANHIRLALVVTNATDTTSVVNFRNSSFLKKFDGWMTVATSTWAYNAYNATTRVGIITVPTDATLTYSKGMRVKFTQVTGGTKHGIIVDVTSTTLHVFMESGKTLANETISSPFYSNIKIPFGFPASPTSWQITGGTDGSQGTPTANVWYNIGGSITVGRGAWLLGYKTSFYGGRNAGSTAETSVTLSTANNTQSDAQWSYSHRNTAAGATSTELRVPAWVERYVDFTADQTMYLNMANDTGGAGSTIYTQNTRITATCAYL